jgi:bacterial/archaeal transporter family protein
MSALFFALLAIFFWGSSPVLEKVALRGVSPIVGVSIRSIVVVIAMMGVAAATGEIKNIPQVRGLTLAYLAIAAISAGLIGQVFYFSALKLGQPSLVVPLVGAYPLITMILSVAFLKEAVTWPKALGAVLIVSGVALLGWSRQ